MPLEIIELPLDAADAAAQLWQSAGLVRPWNDPQGDFRRAVQGPTSAVLGTVRGPAGPEQRVLATAMVGADGHRGWVYYVAVDPELQGQGVGTELMRSAEEWLHKAGAPKVQLMVRHTNAQVVKFYERLGYTDQSTTVLGKFLDPKLEALKLRLTS